MDKEIYKKGAKFIWNPINRATKQVEIGNVHCGKVVTVIEIDSVRLGTIRISVDDDFPQCNWRESKNQFIAIADKLIPI